MPEEVLTTDKTDYVLQVCKCHFCGLKREATFAFDFYPSNSKDSEGHNYLMCERCLMKEAHKADKAKVTVAVEVPETPKEEPRGIELRIKREKAKQKDIWETI